MELCLLVFVLAGCVGFLQARYGGEDGADHD